MSKKNKKAESAPPSGAEIQQATSMVEVALKANPTDFPEFAKNKRAAITALYVAAAENIGADPVGSAIDEKAAEIASKVSVHTGIATFNARKATGPGRECKGEVSEGGLTKYIGFVRGAFKGRDGNTNAKCMDAMKLLFGDGYEADVLPLLPRAHEAIQKYGVVYGAVKAEQASVSAPALENAPA